MSRWLCLVCCLVSMVGLAETPDTIRLSKVQNRAYLYQFATSAETQLATSLAEVKRQSTPLRLSQETKTHAHNAYWLHVYLHNDRDSTQQVFLYILDNQTATVYLSGQSDSLRAGVMVPTDQWATEESDQYIPLTLQPHETLDLYIRLANATGWLPFWTTINRPPVKLGLLLEREAYHYKRSFDGFRRNMPEFQYRSWFQGALLFF